MPVICHDSRPCFKINMEIKYINHTDIVVAGASLLSIIIMTINTLFYSVIPLYISDIVTIGAFLYWSIRKDSTKFLVRSLIMGGIVGVLYTFLDSLFAEVEITTYLRNDVKILSTPVSVVLFWTFFITTMMYLYHTTLWNKNLSTIWTISFQSSHCFYSFFRRT